MTGNWVGDGLVFYLQDVSAGKPLTLENTLGAVTVTVTSNAPVGLGGDDVADAIERALGQRPRLVSRLPTMLGLVYLAHVAEGKVVLKAAHSAEDTAIVLEGWACERVRQLGVPAPRVLTVDTSRRFLSRSYLIMEHVTGTPLHTPGVPPDLVRTALREAGSYLRLIHSVALEGYGWLDETVFLQGGFVRGRMGTWQEATRWCLRDGTMYLQEHGLLTQDTLDALDHTVERYESLLAYRLPGCLLHGDLDPAHIFVDHVTGRVTGIVDFGERLSGDPAWDLARFSLTGAPSQLTGVIEGYEPDRDLHRTLPLKIPFYRLIQAISAARWHHAGGLTEESAQYLGVARTALEALA